MRNKRIIVIGLGLALICTGCGSSAKEESAKSDSRYSDEYSYNAYDYETAGNDGLNEYASADDEEDTYDEYAYDETTTDENEKNEAETTDFQGGEINLEMLVYRGELTIDSLDFSASVDSFKEMLAENGGFVESESYTDNCSTSVYYVTDRASKKNVYTALVRVPSSKYEDLMNSSTALGDVRNRSSNAENVTQQYSTYKSQLEIYEAEYSRYLTLLENATEDEYALQIENELFDIQLQMANLKSGIVNIENDVAYSYISITIKEVAEYVEEPAESDTFVKRLKNTCHDSWKEFLGFLENVVFWFIMNIYWIIVLVVIIFVVWKLIRKNYKNKKLENSEKCTNK